MPGGAVTSLFSYNLITKQQAESGDLRNEIDFEFASNHWTDSPPRLNTNVYGSQNGGGTGGTGKMGVQNADGVNFQNFNTFSLEFNPSGGAGMITWLINKKRDCIWDDYSSPHFPHPELSDGMRLHLNFWAPAFDWDWAYNQDLQPSSSPPGQEWVYYVKNASVYYWE
jgi:Glycosyl hydrolases family 16